ncbi:hypothetical protein NDU88_009240 [Pleurodeles waltl]|uniref:Uncharacterized protein n=1 Tax=Pleurodeles waltl TaxID=8319 RepID=A0AAV7P1L6_PLEWA|nr:hypothetical protein NDU88_009240 [Pleurodeles waltl]
MDCYKIQVLAVPLSRAGSGQPPPTSHSQPSVLKVQCYQRPGHTLNHTGGHEQEGPHPITTGDEPRVVATQDSSVDRSGPARLAQNSALLGASDLRSIMTGSTPHQVANFLANELTQDRLGVGHLTSLLSGGRGSRSNHTTSRPLQRPPRGLPVPAASIAAQAQAAPRSSLYALGPNWQIGRALVAARNR